MIFKESIYFKSSWASIATVEKVLQKSPEKISKDVDEENPVFDSFVSKKNLEKEGNLSFWLSGLSLLLQHLASRKPKLGI